MHEIPMECMDRLWNVQVYYTVYCTVNCIVYCTVYYRGFNRGYNRGSNTDSYNRKRNRYIEQLSSRAAGDTAAGSNGGGACKLNPQANSLPHGHPCTDIPWNSMDSMKCHGTHRIPWTPWTSMNSMDFRGFREIHGL